MSQLSSPYVPGLLETFMTLPKTEIASFNSRKSIIEGAFLIVTELEVLKVDLPLLLFSRSREGTKEFPTLRDTSLMLRQLSSLKGDPFNFFLVPLIFYMKWRI